MKVEVKLLKNETLFIDKLLLATQQIWRIPCPLSSSFTEMQSNVFAHRCSLLTFPYFLYCFKQFLILIQVRQTLRQQRVLTLLLGYVRTTLGIFSRLHVKLSGILIIAQTQPQFPSCLFLEKTLNQFYAIKGSVEHFGETFHPPLR